MAEVVTPKVKVFISWSGEQSRIVAKALKEFIQSVIQASEPFMSSQDIRAGSKWQVEINTKLQESGVGIICITPDNQKEPWLNFEAGAISTFARRGEKEASVCPYLLDIKPNDVDNPLAMFHFKEATEEGTKGLIQMINDLSPSPLSETQLHRTFSKFWPEFQEQLGAARKAVGPATPHRRTVSEKLDEVLTGVRQISQQIAEFTPEGSGVSEYLDRKSNRGSLLEKLGYTKAEIAQLAQARADALRKVMKPEGSGEKD